MAGRGWARGSKDGATVRASLCRGSRVKLGVGGAQEGVTQTAPKTEPQVVEFLNPQPNSGHGRLQPGACSEGDLEIACANSEGPPGPQKREPRRIVIQLLGPLARTFGMCEKKGGGSLQANILGFHLVCIAACLFPSRERERGCEICWSHK